jgi:hypothetical protein
VTGVRVGICVGDGGCASWGGVQVGFANWEFKFGCSNRGVVNSWFPSFDGVSLPTTSR